jgi:hypothetical protein
MMPLPGIVTAYPPELQVAGLRQKGEDDNPGQKKTGRYAWLRMVEHD